MGVGPVPEQALNPPPQGGRRLFPGDNGDMSNHPQSPYPQSPYPGAPQQGGPYQQVGVGGAELIPTEDRSAAALAHFSTIIAMVLSAGSLSFIGPLLIWMLYKDRSGYVRRAAAGAFNFNVWLTIATIIAWLMVFSVVLSPIGFVLMAVTAILQIWCHVRAGLKALQGEDYRYRFQTGILR